jgi:hypothetical protein
MDPDVIRSIKQAALDLDWTASDIMEEAGKQWLQSKTKKGSVRLGGRGPPDYRDKTARTIKAGSQISRIRVRTVANR